MNTTSISPIELKVGDRVSYYGALVEVARIENREDDTPGGIRVAACISRLVGDDLGSIPRGWYDTPDSMRRSGCTWATELEPGLYVNVQGNAHARVSKVTA